MAGHRAGQPRQCRGEALDSRVKPRGCRSGDGDPAIDERQGVLLELQRLGEAQRYGRARHALIELGCPVLRAGLIDQIAYEDEALAALRAVKAGSAPNTIEGDRYARVPLSSLGLNRGPRIGVVYATGAIVSGRGGFDPLNGQSLGSDTLIEAIRTAGKDSNLKAIVLRIDSPGGSAAASDAIWRELMLVKVRAIGKDREEMKRMADIFRGRIIDVTDKDYTIELTGTGSKLDAFLSAIDRTAILETVRTGASGIGRGDRVLRV